MEMSDSFKEELVKYYKKREDESNCMNLMGSIYKELESLSPCPARIEKERELRELEYDLANIREYLSIYASFLIDGMVKYGVLQLPDGCTGAQLINN